MAEEIKSVTDEQKTAEAAKVEAKKSEAAKAELAKAKHSFALSYTPLNTSSGSMTGRGYQLGYATTNGGTLIPIAELFDGNLPKITIGKLDSTNYLSAAVEVKPNGWPEIGDQTFKVRYTNAQAVTLFALAQSQATVFWTVSLPGATTAQVYNFAGFVNSVGGDPVPNKDLIANTIVITGTGVMSVTAGT
jgi:hypothetical protein